METKAHAELSASGSEIWLNCPGSVSLSRKAPPKPESAYANEGTQAHDLLEKLARNTFLPHISKVSTSEINKYPPAMLKAVKFAIAEIHKSYRRGMTLLIEEKVSLEHIGPDMFGTVDIGVVDEFGTLEVTDYKHGSGIKVEVYKETATGAKTLNTQLVYYALGLARKYHYNFKNVTLKIVQPRCAIGKPVSAVTVPMKELMTYEDLFRKGVARTKDKNARRHPGPWCKFCKAKPICNESKEGYRTPSRDDFSEI